MKQQKINRRQTRMRDEPNGISKVSDGSSKQSQMYHRQKIREDAAPKSSDDANADQIPMYHRQPGRTLVKSENRDTDDTERQISVRRPAFSDTGDVRSDDHAGEKMNRWSRFHDSDHSNTLSGTNNKQRRKISSLRHDVRDGESEPLRISDKLKNESSAKKAAGRKLRRGKADNSVNTKQMHRHPQSQSIARRMVHEQLDDSDEYSNDETSRQIFDDGTHSAQVVAEGIRDRARKNRYKRKQNAYSEKIRKSKRSDDGVSEAYKAKKKAQRKYYQHEAQKNTEKAGRKAGQETAKAVKKAAEVVTHTVQSAVKVVAENPIVLFFLLMMLLVAILAAVVTTVSFTLTGGTIDISTAATFTAEDDDILQVEADYKSKEEELRKKIDNIETDYPGYDEYRYNLAEINHNPYQLAALLTVLYEDYTPEEVSAKLQEIFDIQYKLTLTPSTETRTRTNSDGETEEYEVKILTVTLINNTMQAAVDAAGFDEDQKARYDLLMETLGNKSYLFGDDQYSNPMPGEYQDYQVPAEALTDEKFGKMLHEAEKYLGYPYVWGGSSPSTSFDCSGFVCWVINNAGNGWNVGRTTANGLRSHTTKVSPGDAKPGDLIFFQGTYNTAGASHVGIYVGDGKMIHCGNPIQYASVNSNYWRAHFLEYGRIR